MSSSSPSTVSSAVRSIADGITVSPRTRMRPSGEIVLLEEGLDRLQVVARRHVHDGEVFVVEAAMRGGAVLVALDEVVEHAAVRLDVAIGVHRDEGRELQEAGIDPAERAGMPRRHGRDHVPLEPAGSSAAGRAGSRRWARRGCPPGRPSGSWCAAAPGRCAVASSETAATTAGAGWQTATTWVSGPRWLQEADDGLDVAATGRNRHTAAARCARPANR